MDHIARVLSISNKQLVSVDFWKSYTLSPVGLRFLTCLKQLEEIDLGWWFVFIIFILKINYASNKLVNRFSQHDGLFKFSVWV